MLTVGSNLNPLTNQEEETLVGMGRDEVLVQDVEEGEISDSGSIEEISEEDFKKQDARVLRTNGGSNANANANSNARVWTMRDVYRYPISSGYTSGLYNLAWAQAVQNKSLDEVFVKIDPNDNSKRSPSSSSSISTPVNSREDKSNCVDFPKEATKIVIGAIGDGMDAKMDDPEEKEEGELEEGEIDLDLEPTEEPQDAEEGVLRSNLKASDDPEVILEERDMEKVVNSILESLKTVTVVDAEKSFTGVCWRLQNILEKLQEVILGKSVPMKDTLLLRSFSAIQTVHSVFCSMVQKEQNKDILTRLLAWVMRQIPPLFIPDQMKEIEAMISSIDNFAALPSIKAIDIEKELNVILGVNQSDSEMLAEKMEHELNSSKSFLLDSTSSKSLNKNGLNMLSVVLKPVLSGLKGRAGFGPLIDLHKDHDIESLPSPTREAPSCLLAQSTLALGDGLRKPELAKPLVACKAQDPMIHPYETDALAAVSTYQQKFGQNSFLSGNRLPSPTPSEGGDNGDDDTNEEVSSRASNINIMKAFSPPLVSSAPGMESGSAQGMTGMEYVGSLSSGSNPTIRASAKSRDPRLRLANSNVKVLDLNQRPLPVVYDASIVDLGGKSGKHKPAEDSVFNGPAMKKPRTVSRTYGAANDVQTFSGTGGWLEDTGTLGPQFTNKYKLMENDGLDTNLRNGITSSGAGSGKDTVISGSDRLPAILKNIAVNPSMLLDILKQNEQQRLSVEAQQKSAEPAKIAAHLPSTKNLAVPSSNVSPVKPSGFAQKPLGKLEGLSQAASMNPLDEMGKVRMKPRDPRRILLNNTLQNSGRLGSEQLKINEGPTLNTQESKLAVATSRPSLSAPPPDITSQFTKNLKNIADLMSASQASTTPTIQQIPSPPVQVTSSGVDVKPVIPDSERNRIGTPLTPTEGVATTNQSQNNWGDVEHLFEGFDDQQKAAIQKERTRRLEEQKKMFAARRLCLVLDLDHTLLNSAKFGEVDPLHEEMLRKKEEQDCEKPQRHLFRFPHMGMWTKLRPGIWNFLEKASKLYELHLYTMGNKLYATEMAKVLDTKGVLFSGRVIARGDDGDLFDGEERVPKIKDLDGVLGMESSIVIIDDSVRVWPHNKLNLIVVERYTYFPSSRRQFGLPGPSLLEIDHDERQEDGTLASSLAVIEKLHQMFFANQSLDEVDVRNILASEQRRILSGCRIVFSRVFPVGEASPHLHPLWQTAEQFGAVCTNQIDEQVTHVVANSLGTDKVNWAISTGRYVVHPGWVEASALLYRRASEQDFAVKP